MRSHPYTVPPPLPPLLDEIADELVSILPNQGSPRRHSEETEFELCELDPDTSRLIPVRQKRHHVRVQGKLVVVRSVSTANLRSPGISGGSGAGAAVTAANKRISSVPMMTRLDSSSKLSPGLGSGSGYASGGSSSNNLLSPRYDPGVGVNTERLNRRLTRRQSYDGSAIPAGSNNDGEDTKTEEEVRETIVRDRQLRGYGIGGAGNIRRPTDVIHFPERRSSPAMLLFSSVVPLASPSFSPSSSTPTTPATPGLDKRRWNLREMFGLTPGGERKGKARAMATES